MLTTYLATLRNTLGNTPNARAYARTYEAVSDATTAMPEMVQKSWISLMISIKKGEPWVVEVQDPVPDGTQKQRQKASIKLIFGC